MKGVGMVLAIVGIVMMVVQMFMGIIKYHLSRSHDMHKFILWMAVGLVIAIIGALLARRGNE